MLPVLVLSVCLGGTPATLPSGFQLLPRPTLLSALDTPEAPPAPEAAPGRLARPARITVELLAGSAGMVSGWFLASYMSTIPGMWFPPMLVPPIAGLAVAAYAAPVIGAIIAFELSLPSNASAPRTGSDPRPGDIAGGAAAGPSLTWRF